MRKFLIAGMLLMGLFAVATAGFALPSSADSSIVLNENQTYEPQRMGRGCGAQAMSPVQTLAELTGLTFAEIREMRLAGSSLAEIAKSQGIELEDLVNAILAKRAEVLQQMVEEGRISQELADERLETMKSMIVEMLERTDGCDQRGYMMENMKERMGGMMNGKGFGGEMGRGMKGNIQ